MMITRTTRSLVRTLTLTAATTVATSLPAAAAMMAGSTPSAQDTTFAVKAAQGGLAEVSAARFALTRSTNANVRAFASRMIADHTKANAQLTAIAKAQNLRLPHSVGPSDEQQMKALQALRGTTFDAAYLQQQHASHASTQALFTAEAAKGSDAQLVAFAKTVLPVVAQHIELDRRDVAALASHTAAHTKPSR